MKNIIFPINFSSAAYNALPTAVSFAKMMEAKLNVIHVFNPVVLPEKVQNTDLFIGSASKEVIAAMESLKVKLSKEIGLNYSCQLIQGWLGEVIHSFAKKNPSTIIIMGTDGHDETINFPYGSSTLFVSENNDTPLLSIPSSFKGAIIQKAEFIFPVDFEQINDWEVLESFKEIARKFEARIHIFCVIDNMEEEAYLYFQKQMLARLEDYFEGIELRITYSRKQNVSEAIKKFSSSHKASMLVMVRHHRSFFEELLHTSITKGMLLHSHIPCLIIPDKKAEMNLASVIGYW
jgi:nucleotide-binding universal stress UspA family protein